MKTTKNRDFKPYYIVTFFVVMFVTLFSALNLVPVITKSGDSSAETADVSVEIDPVIALSLSKENINLDVIPTGAGAFVYDTTIANVSTNNKTGYTLTMNTKTDETALIQEGTDYEVASLTDSIEVTASDQTGFTVNHWGYAKSNGLNADGNTTFDKIPSLSDQVTLSTSNEPTLNSNTPVTFAARLNTSTVSGIYTNTMTFSATTNFVPGPEVPTFSGITTMQEMTADICAAETTPTKEATESTTVHSDDTNLVPEAVLTDTRDNETYTVRKLADGNCWMSQNLRLQLSTSTPLTSADSDVASSWTPDLDSQTTTGTSWGDIYNATDVNKARSYVNTENTEYGGYYSWYAATASTGTYEMYAQGTKDTSSICPKGWQLPEGYTSMNKSFGNLTTTYYGTNDYTSHNGAMLEKPFSFPLSGSYNSSDGQIYGTGSYEYWWSSTVYDSINTFTMYVISSNVQPQSSNGKANGFTVRCVAR